MLADAAIAPVAEILSDPARVAMLMALSDGREVAAGDLALAAGITAPTASAHLARLATVGLIGVRRDGRHRFYRLVRPELVQAMEALAVLAPEAAPRTHRQARIGRAVRAARTCYDHLAGQLGVGVTEALVKRAAIVLDGRQFELTPNGSAFFEQFGIDLDDVRGRRRGFAPACLDWSERVPHIAGSLGAALLTAFFDHAWLKRMPDSRAVTVTTAGRRGLQRIFGVTHDV